MEETRHLFPPAGLPLAFHQSGRPETWCRAVLRTQQRDGWSFGFHYSI